MNKVFFFWPNIIGYLRVGLYAGSFFAHSLGHWIGCASLYSLGFILDEFDGRAAQFFDQRTQFGAALDMVTDRAASAGLCVILAQLYPACTLPFIFLIGLDLGSHYYLLYATALVGHRNHKESATWSRNWLLNLYYGNKPFMDLLIVGSECFYIFLYLGRYASSSNLLFLSLFPDEKLDIWQLFLLVCSPIYLLKQATNIAQLYSSAEKISAIDLTMREMKADEQK